MIPLRDENPTEITPLITLAFIALNLAAWFMLQGAGTPQALEASVIAFGTVPCEVTGACPAEGLGWSAILTSMFMHGSWEHILGNMLFLWVFGNNIEDSMGHLRFIVFYLVCGIAAALAHIYLSPNSRIPAVGASGAISGVMGAYIVLYPRVRVQTWIPPFFMVNLNAFFLLAYWFVIQLFTGVVSFGPEMGEQGGVAVWAHVGGFVAGLALIKVFEKPRLVSAKRHKERLSREEVARLEW
ncbi:MAG TPA: rhomboid family intramembrane serine protease [Longimicrobiaceae bacterium]|nr:rhomboid family intramembrane serine protease [Longimicrobiaceae bacterium]